jgi:hypothetical protein
VQDKPCDPSVQSLAAFPQVLAMLGEKPEWVRDLGDAFLGQPNDVMDSVQFLRAKAKDAGNLGTNEQQIITVEPAPPPPQTIVVTAPPPPTQIITIAPANPQVAFVPIYNPVCIFGPWWHPLFPPLFFPPPPRWGFVWNPVGAAIVWGVGIGISNALWGGVNWGRRDVTINVNRWNNINVNNRISSNDRTVNWNHNPGNRRGVPYRDSVTRDRVLQNIGSGREDYRGRLDQRAQARAALADRVGAENLDRDALRNIDRSQIPQLPAAGTDGTLRDRSAAVDRSQARERVASIDRNQVENRAAQINRDNALRGADDGRRTRQQADRGNASLATQRQAAGGRQADAAAAVQRLRNR